MTRARAALLTVLVLVLLGIAGLTAASWYYAGQVLTPERAAGPPSFDLRVVAGGRDRVTLRGPGADRPGVWGLRWDGGYAQLGGPVEAEGDDVVRPVLHGSVPGDVGHALLDGMAFAPGRPPAALDLSEVEIPSAVGLLPAWYREGTGQTWAILVHGRSGERREGLRAAAALARARGRELPLLLMTYRNDPGAPASGNGLYGLGSSEWEDVAAAVHFAVERGAHRVVLFGFSTGGQIVAEFLHRGARADTVAGVVLDSPVLDWRPVLELAARQRGLPRWLTPFAMAATQVRGDLSFAALDQVAKAERFDVPVLLFHGTDDEVVPVSTSDAFAAARRDLVTYVRLPDVAHVEAWNRDPGAYARALDAFLDEVLAA